MNPSIDLEVAQADFFASGGQLVDLGSYQYVPFPQRKHPEPRKKPVKPAAGKSAGSRKSTARARSEKIAELAKTMTCGEVAELLGETKGALWGVAAREGFKFLSRPNIPKPEKPTVDQAKEDQALADQIIALRDTGASRCAVTAKLKIGNRKLERILAAFQINFPLQRYRE